MEKIRRLFVGGILKKEYVKRIQLICLPLAIYIVAMIIFYNAGFLDIEDLRSNHFTVAVFYAVAMLLDLKFIGLGLLISSGLGTYAEYSLSQNEAVEVLDFSLRNMFFMFGVILSFLAQMYSSRKR